MKRQDAVEARLDRILKRGDVPTLGEHVRELTARLANPETTIQDVQPILRTDVGLAARVFRTANSAQFNRSGRPISSLSHGVALIGLEALRDMTMPLLTRLESQPAAVRPVAGAAILTAAQARSAAMYLRLSHLDDAYLCGLFRGLGELLTAHFFPQDYSRILAQAKDGRVSETAAAMRTMQCSYEDLGQAAARAWNLPPAVIATMHSEPLLGPALRSDNDRLRASVSFAHEVVGAVHRTSGGARRDRLARVLRIFGKPMGLRTEDIQRLVQEVLDETRESLANLALTPDALLLETQFAAAVRDAERPKPGSEPDPEPQPPPQPSQPQPLNQIEARIRRPGWQLENGIVDALDLICQEGPFDQALFLLLSADRQELVGRLSSSLAPPASTIRIPLVRSQGQAAAAVLARRDIFVQGGSRPTRDWPGDPPACFGVLPVVIDRIVAGAIYFERRQDPTPVSPPLAGRLAAARDLVGRMIAAQRSLSHVGA